MDFHHFKQKHQLNYNLLWDFLPIMPISMRKREQISVSSLKIIPGTVSPLGSYRNQGFFQQFGEKAPSRNWEKKIDLTAKLGEINDIEHNKGSKIYPQNSVILDCSMPSIPLMHKYLSIILIWVIVSH